MAKKAAESYKLKDPKTTFYDPETKFKVVADKPSEVDPDKGKGKLTAAAIVAGGLIEVGKESKAAAEEGEEEPKGKKK